METTSSVSTIPTGAVVVAVDGSKHGERALDWAAAQAVLEHRPLAVVHAVSVVDARTAAWSAGVAGLLDDLEADLVEGGRALLAAAVDRVHQQHPDLEVTTAAYVGEPRVTLIDVSHEAHLLVLGSRGRGALRSLVLGSVSSAVSAHAHCPVVVTRPPRDGERLGVVVGTDLTAGSVAVVEFAARQASMHGLPLTVTHFYWDAATALAAMQGLVLTPDPDELALLMSESIAGLQEKYPDVPITTRLEHGLVDQAINRGPGSWDLVVVGRHTGSLADRLFLGSMSTSVLERARTTVAVVPQPTDEDR